MAEAQPPTEHDVNAAAVSSGPPDGSGHPHPENKLFVMNFYPNSDEVRLEQIFRPYGNVVDKKVLVDKYTGQKKGAAFVKFSTRAEAEAAIANLNGKPLANMTQPLLVKWADTEQERDARFRSKAPRYDHSGIISHMPSHFPPRMDPIARPNPAAMAAYTGGRPANLFRGPTGMSSTGQPMYTVMVTSLPFEADDNVLYKIFGPYGGVAGVKVVRDPQQNRSKGIGFVDYLRPEDATAAIYALDGQHVMGRVIHCQVKTPKGAPAPVFYPMPPGAPVGAPAPPGAAPPGGYPYGAHPPPTAPPGAAPPAGMFPPGSLDPAFAAAYYPAAAPPPPRQ